MESSSRTSSLRTFFNIRNTVPGLTFILTILLINLREIERFVSRYWMYFKIDIITGLNFIFSAFLLSIVLSVLVSQLWYLIWNLIYECCFTNFQWYPFNFLKDKYHIDPDPRNLLFAYHYINSIAESEMRNYLDRRQDLINLLGSSIVSIWIAIHCGLLLKQYIDIKYIQNPNVNFELLYYKDYKNIGRYEHILIISLIILCFLMIVGLLKVIYQHFHMTLISLHMRCDKDLIINRLQNMDVIKYKCKKYDTYYMCRNCYFPFFILLVSIILLFIIYNPMSIFF